MWYLKIISKILDFEEEEKVQVQTTKDTEQKLEAGDAPVNPTAAN